MIYKKLFFPVGGGEELRERVRGALLIANHFQTHLEIFKANLFPNSERYKYLGIPQNLIDEMDIIARKQFDQSHKECEELLQQEAQKAGVVISQTPLESQATVFAKIKEGDRSTLVAQESKFCDLVIAAAPPSGLTTATFETSVTKSGKSVLMFPRVMEQFDTQSIIIGWNNSPEVSRAITQAIPLLKRAKKVHIITAKEYANNLDDLGELEAYLKLHGINPTSEMIKTTRVPGEALYQEAMNGSFDLIVAGAYGHKGLRELFLGGATRYLLEHSTLPVFMSH